MDGYQFSAAVIESILKFFGALAWPAAVVVPSGAVKEHLVRYERVPEGRIDVINIGFRFENVAESVARGKAVRERLGLNDSLVVGSVGRDLGVALGRMVGEGFLAVHTRDEEREADFLGVRTMSHAGFDSQGMITMFQKLRRIEEQDSSLLGTLFSDHPDAQERIDNTRYEIGRMRQRR